MRGALDGVEGIGRRQSIGPDIARFAFDLLLDAGDADLEKFVEIGTEDGEEFYPLDQRLRRVLRFFQDAPVKLKPAQLAIDEIFRRGKFRLPVMFTGVRQRDDVVRSQRMKLLFAIWSMALSSPPLAPRLFAKKPAKYATLFGFSGSDGRRPAFHDFESEKTEESEPGEFQIEAQIFCDLGNGARAIELRSELRFRHGEAKMLHALESIAGVGRNGGGIVVRLVRHILELNETQGAQGPLIDVFFARNALGEIGQALALLENKTDERRGPQLGEKFLSIVLHQLQSRFTQDEIFLGQGEEHRPTRLELLLARRGDARFIDVGQRDRCFRAIQFRIACRDEDDLSILRQNSTDSLSQNDRNVPVSF